METRKAVFEETKRVRGVGTFLGISFLFVVIVVVIVIIIIIIIKSPHRPDD